MAKATFGDPEVGEIDLDEVKCYENINRSTPHEVFGGEVDSIPYQEDEVKLHFKDGTTKTVKGLSDILKLEGLQISECREE